MAEEYYNDARKKGKRAYSLKVAKGESPYLPVLDEVFPDNEKAKKVNLGVIQIPADQIVGTKTKGRTESFAWNFMPLLEETSEFGVKWKALCDAHMTEGIRDPIKVYEYMNRFYVEEGNKRASVLKFFGAVNINAQVTRVLPVRDGSKAVEIYYEFVDFYKVSKINYLEFTKLGSYKEFQRLMGKRPNGEWTEDERRAFKATYHTFSQVYLDKGGDNLKSTIGDALLAYMKIYGFYEIREMNYNSLKKAVSRVWEEITLQQEEAPVDIKTAPVEEKKASSIVSKVIGKATAPVAAVASAAANVAVSAAATAAEAAGVATTVSSKKKLKKVAFIYDKTPELSGWTYAHELGRQHVNCVFDGQLETTVYPYAMEAPQSIIDKAVRDGNSIIFTTSPRMLPYALRAAVDNPDVHILNCSLNKSHRYIATYYARMYEAKFIIGALAGALAENDRVGYICDYPIYGMIAGINAFALGARMVNPRAKIYLEWSAVDGVEAATKKLTDQGIHLISSQDNAKMDAEDHAKNSFGLYREKDGELIKLAMPIWNWGIYYERIIRQLLNKTLQSEYAESKRALNYYWGMSAGVVDIFCSEKLPESTVRFHEFLKRSICNGNLHPLLGPITLQDGTVIDGEENHIFSPTQIANMDQLVDNVIGTIPEYKALKPEGKATVDMVGVKSALKGKDDE